MKITFSYFQHNDNSLRKDKKLVVLYFNVGRTSLQHKKVPIFTTPSILISESAPKIQAKPILQPKPILQR